MKEDRFLRPALTKLLIQRLERGDSLNIHGKEGIGKTRLLKDIKKAGLDASVVLVSLKGYWNSRTCGGNYPAHLRSPGPVATHLF